MHEMSLAEEITTIVRQHLPSGPSSRLRSVTVRLGALSGVVPESLSFCFSVLAQESGLDDARLVIEHVPAEIACGSCGGRNRVEPESIRCPACGSGLVSIVAGRELQVASLEVEEDDVLSAFR